MLLHAMLYMHPCDVAKTINGMITCVKFSACSAFSRATADSCKTNDYRCVLYRLPVGYIIIVIFPKKTTDR